jgi:hypothetical protein
MIVTLRVSPEIVGNVGVGVDVLGIVQIFQHLQQLDHFLRVLQTQGDVGTGALVTSAASGSSPAAVIAALTV